VAASVLMAYLLEGYDNGVDVKVIKTKNLRQKTQFIGNYDRAHRLLTPCLELA
jgi:hypothetical protein